MPFGIVEASSDRLVSVRSTVISGDSDNSDYEVLDLNWCPSNADNHPMVVRHPHSDSSKIVLSLPKSISHTGFTLFVKIQDHMCFSPFIPLEYSKSYPSYHRNNKNGGCNNLIRFILFFQIWKPKVVWVGEGSNRVKDEWIVWLKWQISLVLWAYDPGTSCKQATGKLSANQNSLFTIF